MRTGIISDIHGNLEALTSSISFLKEKVDTLVVLGDIVGYGPDPERCLEIVMAEANLILKGNHEEGIITGNYSSFRNNARISLEWTVRILSDDFLNAIKNFKEREETDEILYVHASVSSPLSKYILSKKDAEEEFGLLEKKICFIGHTHIPAGYMKNGDKIDVIHPDFSGRMEIEINPEYKYIINTGSTGQPRDGFPFACVSIYDTEKCLFTLYRIQYPSDITAKKIIERGLPSILARRVIQGI